MSKSKVIDISVSKYGVFISASKEDKISYITNLNLKSLERLQEQIEMTIVKTKLLIKDGDLDKNGDIKFN